MYKRFFTKKMDKKRLKDISDNILLDSINSTINTVKFNKFMINFSKLFTYKTVLENLESLDNATCYICNELCKNMHNNNFICKKCLEQNRKRYQFHFYLTLLNYAEKH